MKLTTRLAATTILTSLFTLSAPYRRNNPRAFTAGSHGLRARP